jgi:hypothetical protein
LGQASFPGVDVTGFQKQSGGMQSVPTPLSALPTPYFQHPSLVLPAPYPLSVLPRSFPPIIGSLSQFVGSSIQTLFTSGHGTTSSSGGGFAVNPRSDSWLEAPEGSNVTNGRESTSQERLNDYLNS